MGGALNAEGDGSLQTIGSPTLEGVTNNAVFSLNSGTTVSVTGAGLTNNGVVHINPQNAGADAHLHFPASAVLGGTGEVWLRTNNENSQLTAGPGQVVTHGAGHSIRGVGYLSAGLVNEGVVSADVAVAVSGNQLHVFGEPKVNSGLMNAATNSLLDITSTTIDQTSGGVLFAETGGQVRAGNGVLIRGGILGGPGVFSTIGSPTLESVTLDANSSLNSGTTVTIIGAGLVNNGVVEINPQNSGADAFLHFAESGTLGGAGEVRLRTNAENSRLTSADGVVVTHAPTHTVRGVGYVSATLVNGGVVGADASVATSGNTLYVFGGAKTNNALMYAAAGSVLELSATVLTQTGGGEVLALDGAGRVHLGSGLTVVGGELNTAGDGSYQTVGSPTLEGVTSNGPLFLNSGNTVSVAGGGLTNNGIIHINAQNSGADAHLYFPVSGSLDGDGEVWLRTNAENSQISAGTGQVVTHGPAHTIRGIGYLSAGMVNEGLVAADASVGLGGNQLFVFGEPKINNSVMRAEAGSLLDITGTTIDQTGGGTLRAEATGEVRPGGNALIVGGSFGGDGLLTTIGNCALDAVTLDGNSSFNAGTAVTITGGLTNNGQISVNPQNSGADAHIFFPADATISGSGRVNLLTTEENAQLSGPVGVTVTQGPGHSLGGIGQVNVDLDNAGRIEPGNSIGALRFGRDLACLAGSTLGVEVGGVGSSDRVNVTGTLRPGGTVEVSVVGGYTPLLGHTSQIASAGFVDGEFDGVAFEPMRGGRIFVLDYTPTAVTLRVGLGCVADWNLDGSINTLDFLSYLNDWTAGDPIADLTGNGTVDTQDFLAFLNNWVAGC